MAAVSTVIKAVLEKLNEGTSFTLRAQKELSNKLSKAATVHGLLMQSINVEAQQSAPIGNLSYVDRRLQTLEKRKEQLEGRYLHIAKDTTNVDSN
jgi:hypothetical protein